MPILAVLRRCIRHSWAPAAVAAALPQIATGQQAQEEVIVTGSRVARTGFDSPQPLSVIDSQQIESLGIVNVGDVVRMLPQNTPFFTETNVGIGNFNVGAQLANLRGLNPFFGTRTLTLVDTKRVVPNTEGGAVDLTLIPSMLVARTEVVTGGASAAYGSDAIAGVVNVLLNTELEGFRAQIDYGQTFESDGEDTHVSLGYGTAFADADRGHFLVGFEYQKQDPIGPCSISRDWCEEAWAVGTNADYATGNGLPNFVVAPDAKFPTSETGVLTVGGVPMTFSRDGTALLPYDPGRFAGAFTRIGGDGALQGYDISNIRPEVERYSALANVDYRLTDSLEFFAQIAYSESDSLSTPANGALGPLGPGLFIAPDNPFLPAALQGPPGAPVGTFNRVFMPDVISARNTTANETTRFVTGLEGVLGERWSWDVYYQHGRNDNEQRLFNNAVGRLLFVSPPPEYDFIGWALDAVRSDPNDPTSEIVCRATLPGPAFNPLAAGCVPLNLFGIGTADPAALEYAFRTLKEDAQYRQNVVGANFRATVAEGWAGPIAVAAGLEWRRDENEATHDLPNQPWYSSYFLTWGLDRGGELDVLEGYGEIDVPLHESLQTNFAARWTRNEATSLTAPDTSSTNDFTSWKAAALYDPVDWLRLRATLSRDVRAAGFRELFLPRVTLTGAPGGFPGGINNPWNGGAPEAYLNTSGGNPALEPETADTTTFGIVLTFDRFRFSADWYEIDLTDAISPGGLGGLSAQQLVDACFASGGSGAACAKIGGAGTADITAVDASSINIGSFLTRGYDFEAGYTLDLEHGGALSLRVIATYLYDMIIDTGLGSPSQNYAGQSGPVASFGGFNTSPEWQATAWLTYSRDRFSSTFETRYIGSGDLNALWTESPAGAPSNTLPFTVTDNRVDSRLYFSWSGSYDFRGSDSDRSLQLFWVVNNLLDEDPPIAPGGNLYPTNPVFFDTVGRRFRAGVRMAF